MQYLQFESTFVNFDNFDNLENFPPLTIEPLFTILTSLTMTWDLKILRDVANVFNVDLAPRKPRHRAF